MYLLINQKDVLKLPEGLTSKAVELLWKTPFKYRAFLFPLIEALTPQGGGR